MSEDSDCNELIRLLKPSVLPHGCWFWPTLFPNPIVKALQQKGPICFNL